MQRLRQRCEDRGEDFQKIIDKFKHIKVIGKELQEQTDILSK